MSQAVDTAVPPDSPQDPNTFAQRVMLARWAGAAIASALASIAFYGLDRTRAYLVHGPPNPLGMTASHRIEYFWRIGMAVFVASVVLLLWRLLVNGREEAALRWTLRAILPVILVCSVLSVLFP